MATDPIITFKAGRCTFNGRKVVPVPTPGYVSLYSEDDLLHFCWRPRSAPADQPELDLIMFPTDGSFVPWLKEQGAEELHSPTNGRIYVLKFASSSQKYYFWMQSRTQSPSGDPSWFSLRDQKIGQIIDSLLQGEDIDVSGELEDIRNGGSGPNGDADAMEVDGGTSHERHETGDEAREDGEPSRESGAGAGRAAESSSQDANALVQDFLNSLNGGSKAGGQEQADKPFTTLPDLLPSSTTTKYVASAPSQQIDQLCTFLPPELFLLAQESSSSTSAAEVTPATAQAALETLSINQKREILNRVLHSPQLQQSLGSLTVALRDGGLPMIGEALGLKIENGGLIKGGSMPLGGGDAVEAFVNGVKKTVEDEGKGKPS